MLKKYIFLLCLAVLNLQYCEPKNVITSFLSFVKSKINADKDMVKVIQMGNGFVCLTNSENTKHDECSCSFTKLKEFEKRCASNLKKNQEEAKECSEEKCEICCKLENRNKSSISILEYELSCQKKCTKSNLFSDLTEEDNRQVFKKIIEFIRIFYPTTTLHYNPEVKPTVEYTGKVIKKETDTITQDLNSQVEEEAYNENDVSSSNEEEVLSPYDEY